jgi:hypothetical protein
LRRRLKILLTKCGPVQLRFSFELQEGIYSCPGYFDDANATFDLKSLTIDVIVEVKSLNRSYIV